jgi:hypothetical protein
MNALVLQERRDKCNQINKAHSELSIKLSRTSTMTIKDIDSTTGSLPLNHIDRRLRCQNPQSQYVLKGYTLAGNYLLPGETIRMESGVLI